MIYLLKTYGENGKSAFKIGYTKDENHKARLYSYEAHNPFMDIIHTIPNATEVHEKKLHYKFRNHLLFKNEWFSCETEIEDFIKNVTLDDLDNLPDLKLSKQMIKKYRETIRISYAYVIERLKDQSDKFSALKDELILKLSYSNTREYELIDIYDKFELTIEEINSVAKIINRDYDDLAENLKDFLIIILDERDFVKKMKLLCNSSFSQEELEFILKQLPPEFTKYYYVLGPEKIKGWGYMRNNLEREYSKIMFSNNSELEDLVYQEFKEGDRIPLKHIIEKLKIIYERINNPNFPKAIELLKYFKCSKTKVTVYLDNNNTKKVMDGYKLIKKLK